MLADGGDERRHDRAAGHVAAHMHDAALGVGGFARHGEVAFEVAVERHAVVQEIVDARRRVGDHQPRDLLVDDAVAGRDRVGDVLVDRVAGRKRGGDAALRPSPRTRPARSARR